VIGPIAALRLIELSLQAPSAAPRTVARLSVALAGDHQARTRSTRSKNFGYEAPMPPAERTSVRFFYDTFGWRKDAAGRYFDGAMADDWRSVSRWYRVACNERLRRRLASHGDMLLDAASGAVQFDDYVALSEGYRRHVCVDFSRQALVEARSRLGAKALCVQADVTALPFKDDAFDAVASLRTIYHVPVPEQPTAFRELHRTLRPGKSAVVVYAQNRHVGYPLPKRLVDLLLRNRWFARRLDSPTRPPDPPGLYFEPLPLHDVCAILETIGAAYSIRPWRSVSVSFLQLALPDNVIGRLVLRVVFGIETLLPGRCGERANYPTFVVVKDDGIGSGPRPEV
jgi:SAM-dependent methyltransferase